MLEKVKVNLLKETCKKAFKGIKEKSTLHTEEARQEFKHSFSEIVQYQKQWKCL